jgi:hypothetical protein
MGWGEKNGPSIYSWFWLGNFKILCEIELEKNYTWEFEFYNWLEWKIKSYLKINSIKKKIRFEKRECGVVHMKWIKTKKMIDRSIDHLGSVYIILSLLVDATASFFFVSYFLHYFLSSIYLTRINLSNTFIFIIIFLLRWPLLTHHLPHFLSSSLSSINV